MGQIGEAGEFEEGLASGRLVDDIVLEDPGEVVGDKDGVEAGGEGWVDVGAGTVADHPRVTSFAAVMSCQGKIRFVVFFGENLYCAEVGGKAGTLKLVGLFFGIAFGDHDEAVPGGELGERRSHIGQEFNLLVGDGLGEAFDAPAFFVG